MLWKKRNSFIAGLSALAILCYAILRFYFHFQKEVYDQPLLATLLAGGLPVLADLIVKILKKEAGTDLLAALSIITSVLLKEYAAGVVILLMVSGGRLLEEYSARSASSVLEALARRLPSVAHRRRGMVLEEVSVSEIVAGDALTIFPHEICPVDGVVTEGHGTMDEAYLTGEPFRIDKAPGSSVISGAVNGETMFTIRATRPAVDSRYAKIMQVMRLSEQQKPKLRRLGDRLGAVYAPLALLAAVFIWIVTGDPVRFLSVLVVATPCPLLIGIPVTILGAVSFCARRGILVRDLSVFEQIDRCSTAIFDKTGTLTYGEPELAEEFSAPGVVSAEALSLAASLERYSRHPLASAMRNAAREKELALHEASEVREIPGEGLQGIVSGKKVLITSRSVATKHSFPGCVHIPPTAEGLECVVIVDGVYASTLRFRDTPRAESDSFIRHLGPRHHFNRVIIVSGDRESEVRYLAKKVQVAEIHAEKSPEDKVAIVRESTLGSKTLFVGDGINDAPALLAATVGIAIGRNSDITSQAAGAVVMESSLTKVDELIHISRRMRRIALQSAVGGMALSCLAIGFAAVGWLTPVVGAMAQEAIDLLAIFNALRAAFPPKELSDF